MSVFYVLVAVLPVLHIGGIANNMYSLSIPHSLRFRLMIAWTGGVNAGLSMDGGFQGSSYC
jgi:hypothetical protein